MTKTSRCFSARDFFKSDLCKELNKKSAADTAEDSSEDSESSLGAPRWLRSPREGYIGLLTMLIACVVLVHVVI